jgi:hypothetical protein
MATVPARATLDDLYRVEGKAELVGGRIIHPMASGHWPGRIAENIFVSLRLFTRKTGRGEAHADGVGYAVPELASGRESFAPDASYFEGLLPPGWMRFIAGAPRFAAEVRSEGDYGPAAEEEPAVKRADYFEAGTLVVWDVDPQAETVAMYRASAPSEPVLFRRGETADAEPAVPGWLIAVDEIFSH